MGFAHDLAVFVVLKVRWELDGTTRSGVETHHRVVVCNQSFVLDIGRVRTGPLTFSSVKLAGLADLEGVLAEEGIVDLD